MGFSFLFILFIVYIDDSEGVVCGGVLIELNSWMIDVVWGYLFIIGL